MIPVFSMLLAQARNVPVEGGGAGGIIFLIIELAVVVAAIAGLWKTFEKAGKPGWAAIVPFYNLYITLRISGRPDWWLLPLILCPPIGLVFWIIMCLDIATKFGKGAGFGIGLAFLWFIFFPILGFGDAQYQGGTNP